MDIIDEFELSDPELDRYHRQRL